jgi:hypothetical protein
MPKRISKPKGKKKRATEEPDVSQLAHRLVQESVAERNAEPESMTKAQLSQLMAAMGRRGGKIGGKRRLETMTPHERSQLALKAAQARWKKPEKTKQP